MVYKTLQERLEEVISGESNFVANAANFVSLIFYVLKDINWIGFYLVDGDELVIGPFQGKPACSRIPLGKGVCGTSAKDRKVIIVNDVHSYPGYITCDPLTKSELVIPIIFHNYVFGVLDINSPIYNRFNDFDIRNIEALLSTLIQLSDLESLKKYYKNNERPFLD